MNTTNRLILLAERRSNCVTMEEGATLSAPVSVIFAFYIKYVNGSDVVSLS
jgi:hypothetical protein